jgi:hypothetical protein
MNRLLKISCPFQHQGCSQRFRSQKGRTYHIRTVHTNNNNITPPSSPRSVSSQANFELGAPNDPESSSESSHGRFTLDIADQHTDPMIPEPLSPTPSHSTQSEIKNHPWLTGESVYPQHINSHWQFVDKTT